MRLVWAKVESVDLVREGVQRVTATCGGATRRALCYETLTGPCGAGELVLLNTTAVDLELGTGGSDFVVARLGDPAPSSGDVALDRPSGGHVMKLRYTPLQADVLAVEEQNSEHHETMASAEDVDAMPCVCCGLHSQAMLAAAAVKAAQPALRVAYLMTDDGSLPLALSDLAASAKGRGALDATVTCGQAFGGDIESVNLFSGLIAARHVLKADVAVVSIGPGVTGTATAFGHGGVAQGEAINAATAVGGRPVAALRLSFADSRQRHRGVSHHTLTALTKVALAPAFVAVPALPQERAEAVEEALSASGVWDRHVRAEQHADPRLAVELLGTPVKTMGRGVDEEPEFFAAACAAGLVGARLAEHPVAEIG